MIKKYFLIIFAVTTLTLGCAKKIDQISGQYDLEVGGDVCHLLDLKTVNLDSSSITLTGGGSTAYLDVVASMSKAPSAQIAQVRINNATHSRGITTKFTNVEVSDVSIKTAEWDKKSLSAEKILFTKQYTLTLENGKKANLYSNENGRLGIDSYKECIFRK